MPSEPVLCYVRGTFLYFTTQALFDQWGDDWNDAPYEHNAGSPYPYDEHDARRGKAPWSILCVAWSGPFETPADGHLNSPWSVERINRGEVPWLRSDGFGAAPQGSVQIWAGMPYTQAVAGILEGGGMVYAPVSKGEG